MESYIDNKRIAKNTMYMYVRMLVILVVSLYTSRIVYNALGVENYGLYNVVASIIVFLVFINSGLNAATRRYIMAEMTDGDETSQNAVFMTSLKAHGIIALVIFALAETVGLWFTNTHLNVPEERMFAANIAYQMSVLSAMITIMQTPYTSIIISYERMTVYAYLSIFEVVFKLATAFLIVHLPGDVLISYSILVVLSSLLTFLIFMSYCLRTFPICKFSRNSKAGLLKEMFGYMGWSTLGQGAVVASNQGVTLLVNNFCGLVANAAIGVSNNITQVINNFVTNFQVAFNPQITKSYISKDYANLIPFISRSSRYSGFLVLIFLLPICFASKYFLEIWLGNYPQYAVEFCNLSMAYIFLEAITAPLWMVIASDKDIKNYQLIVSAIFLLNVVFSWILLAQGLAPYVVVIVKIVVDAMLIVARLFLVKGKIKDFSIREWVRQSVLLPIVIAAFATVIPALCYFFLVKESVWHNFLLLSLSALLSVSVCVFMMGLSKREKQFVIEKIKTIIHKK